MLCPQGPVVQLHVSMEVNVQRLETRYVSVPWASKERGASMVSFLSHLVKEFIIFINLSSPFLCIAALYSLYSNKLSATLRASELTYIFRGQHVVKALIGPGQTLCFHFANTE